MRTFPKVITDVDEFNEVSPFHFGTIQSLVQHQYNVFCWFEKWVNDGVHASGSTIYLSSANECFIISPIQTGDSFVFTIKKMSE